jgi:hypothetical protein
MKVRLARSAASRNLETDARPYRRLSLGVGLAAEDTILTPSLSPFRDAGRAQRGVATASRVRRLSDDIAAAPAAFRGSGRAGAVAALELPGDVRSREDCNHRNRFHLSSPFDVEAGTEIQACRPGQPHDGRRSEQNAADYFRPRLVITLTMKQMIHIEVLSSLKSWIKRRNTPHRSGSTRYAPRSARRSCSFTKGHRVDG